MVCSYLTKEIAKKVQEFLAIYSDLEWGGDCDDWKRTAGYLFMFVKAVICLCLAKLLYHGVLRSKE